ncbi:MAG: hypothetical protein A3E08_03430 [Candidatus Wildermuthbacteria bacterium RIFCSPHIGHO2_12_FULL_49_13]|nr:MAG: hypothetical protein A3E08_03430 [Candidatus Wildermuthbacteria bacterium RIFCSPHIGHO2_12_FULL_49_13]
MGGLQERSFRSSPQLLGKRMKYALPFLGTQVEEILKRFWRYGGIPHGWIGSPLIPPVVPQRIWGGPIGVIE